MLLPKDRFHFSRSPQGYGRKKSKSKYIISLLVIMVSLAIGIFSVLRIVKVNDNEVTVHEQLTSMWSQMDYEGINRILEPVLAQNPLNREALIYNGFSYFYRGIAKFTLEDKIPLFNAAVENLRKADIENDYPLKGSVRYILAKTYYHKGRYYADLSVEYMLSAIDLGYLGEDSYEYLGLAYSELAEYENSVIYFEKALEQKQSDTLYLVLGQTYFTMEDFVKAEETLMRCINAGDDPGTLQKARFLLGRIYFNRGEYLKAEDQYREILKKNPRSADSHYYLGSIYAELNDNIKARAEWRKALEIDPTHHGARQKLYN